MTDPAQKRYNRRVLGLSVLYALFLFGAVWLFNHLHPPTGPIAYILAILPALPIIGVFAAIGRYLIEERDEYLRAMMVRQALIAGGFMLSIVTAWGFLESFDLVGHIDSYYAAVLWFGGLGVGACVNKFANRGEAA